MGWSENFASQQHRRHRAQSLVSGPLLRLNNRALGGYCCNSWRLSLRCGHTRKLLGFDPEAVFYYQQNNIILRYKQQ